MRNNIYVLFKKPYNHEDSPLFNLVKEHMAKGDRIIGSKMGLAKIGDLPTGVTFYCDVDPTTFKNLKELKNFEVVGTDNDKPKKTTSKKEVKEEAKEDTKEALQDLTESLEEVVEAKEDDNEFHTSAAQAILDEPNFLIARKMLRQMWPDAPVKNRAMVDAHCKKILGE